MKSIANLVLSLIVLLSPTISQAWEIGLLKEPYSLFIGPEVYHLKKTREGGSKQSGWLYGGRAFFERDKRNGFYVGIDGYYAKGRITGKTAKGNRLKSDLTDREIEGRLGYSLCFKLFPKLTFTPYGGYGMLYSTNDFLHPSPIPCEYHNRLKYWAAGLRTAICLTSSLEAQLNFKAKFMIKGENHIKKDPLYNSITLGMSNKTQYEVEIPLRYATCWGCRNVEVYVGPFYRFRHYGPRLNYPFDFIDTKFHIYGAQALIRLSF